MDTIFICILRIIIYLIVLYICAFTVFFVKESIKLKKNIISSILLVVFSIFLPYMTLFYGTVQDIDIDFPFLCESYEIIKTNIINNGKNTPMNAYCLEGSYNEMIYSMSFFEDYGDYEESVTDDNVTSGTIDGIHYTASPLIAQRERQLAYSFTGAYSGEIVLTKDNEQIVIYYGICKDRWYNILFVSRVPDFNVAEAIVNASTVL